MSLRTCSGMGTGSRPASKSRRRLFVCSLRASAYDSRKKSAQYLQLQENRLEFVIKKKGIQMATNINGVRLNHTLATPRLKKALRSLFEGKLVLINVVSLCMNRSITRSAR